MLAQASLDAGAFEEFYRLHVDKTVRFAARRSGDPQAVADLVATVWLEAIAGLGRFDPAKGKAVPWLMGIAAHVCADDRRRRNREQDAARKLAAQRSLDDNDIARLEAEIDAVALAPALKRALAELPPSERAVAELVVVEGVAPAEAAAALGTTAAAARVRLARARRKLRKALSAAERSGEANSAPVLIEDVTR